MVWPSKNSTTADKLLHHLNVVLEATLYNVTVYHI